MSNIKTHSAEEMIRLFQTAATQKNNEKGLNANKELLSINEHLL